MTRTHELRCNPETFEALWLGMQSFLVLTPEQCETKTFEVGESVRLRSVTYTPVNPKYKGHTEFGAGAVSGNKLVVATIRQVDQREGFCVLGFATGVDRHEGKLQRPALAVVLQREPTEIIGYCCPLCGFFSSPAIYLAKRDVAERAAKQLAERCCQRVCEDCNCDLEKGSFIIYCRACMKKRDDEKSAERRAKAERIPEAEYGGPIFCDAEIGPQEGYFPNTQELRDWFDCGGEGDEWPTEVWACTISKLELDAGNILEHAFQDHHEDASEEISRTSEDLLQDLLNKWVEEHSSVESYHADHTRLVVMGDPPKIDEEENEEDDDNEPAESGTEQPTDEPSAP
jgi:hypothetical protein